MKNLGLSAAVKDCKFVFHIYCFSFPISCSKTPRWFNKASCSRYNKISCRLVLKVILCRKVVLTSSIAAISCGLSGHPSRSGHAYSEEDWSPAEAACLPYEWSKLFAERAAWDFIKKLPDEKKFDLAVINPAFVQGPILTNSVGTSVDIVKGLLTGDIPGSFDINFCLMYEMLHRLI